MLLLSSCAKEEQVGKIIKQKVNFKTQDGLTIYANFYPEPSNKGIILLHDYGQNKNSWNFFIDKLRTEGYNVIALDFRGHGESVSNSVKNDDFRNMHLDVKSAFDYFNGKGIAEVSIIGSKMGANVALVYTAKEESIQRVVLLSPSLNPNSLKIDNSIKEYKRPLLIIVGALNESLWEDSNLLFDMSLSKIRLQPYETTLQGISVLENFEDSQNLVIKWIKEN